MLSAGISDFSPGFREIPIITISFPGKLRSDDECGIRMLWRKKGRLSNLFLAVKYSSYRSRNSRSDSQFPPFSVERTRWKALMSWLV